MRDESLDCTAAEYGLGTLDETERTAFAERLEREEAARAAVAGWASLWRSFDAAIPAIQPPADMWTRIERSLKTDKGAPALRVIEGGFRGRLSTHRTDSVFRSRNRWRAAALLLGMISVALVGLEFRDQRASERVPSRSFVAVVSKGGVQPALIVDVNTAQSRVLVRTVDATPPAGHSLELWYINDGAKPQSMGVIAPQVRSTPIPSDLRLDGQTTLAVSLEPEGGSKTGSPTGPVLYSGKLIAE